MNFTHCIYQTGKTSLQTVLIQDAADTLRAAWTSKRLPDGSFTPDKLASDYLVELNATREPGSPEFQIMEWDAVAPLIEAAQNAAYVDPDWTEITFEQYEEMLNVLPPCRWETCNGVNLFYISEAMASNIHGHYARYAGRYFTRQCRTSIPYSTLAAEVRLKADSTPVAV